MAVALRIITFTHCGFAVRSGGHNANPNTSSIGETGIVLDLSEMNTIELSSEGDIVSLGPGATWDKVYEELEQHKLTVPGGRLAGIGVGGLITGGPSNSSS